MTVQALAATPVAIAFDRGEGQPLNWKRVDSVARIEEHVRCLVIMRDFEMHLRLHNGGLVRIKPRRPRPPRRLALRDFRETHDNLESPSVIPCLSALRPQIPVLVFPSSGQPLLGEWRS